MVRSALGILHNCVKCPGNLCVYQDLDAVDTLQPCLKQDRDLTLSSACAISYIPYEEDGTPATVPDKVT